MSKKSIISLILATLYLTNPSQTRALENIQITTINPDINAASATFQSHNQKVVANQYGIFVSYLHGQSEGYTKNHWKLLRSIDGGSSFSTVYESPRLIGTNPPVIETDSQGRIYLAHPDWSNSANPTYFYRFSSTTNFMSPDYVTSVNDTGDGKYAMILDESRQQLFWITNLGKAVIMGTDGSHKKTYDLLAAGSNAYPMYPHLYMDNNVLYLAWTTQKRSHYLYHDIHFMRSLDGGNTWQKTDGTPLSTPVIVDDTGPTQRITLDDEFDYHTFLSSFLVKNGKAHFFYLSQSNPSRQHYVRYDLATHRIDKNLYPVWQGQEISISSLDGFCATDSTNNNSPIYCTANATNGRIGTLVSSDNGSSWNDFAISTIPNQHGYGISGSRKITSDGHIIGVYVVQDNSGAESHDINFLKIKTTDIVLPKPGDLNGDGHVNYADFSELISNFGNPYTIFDFNEIVSNYGN